MKFKSTILIFILMIFLVGTLTVSAQIEDFSKIKIDKIKINKSEMKDWDKYGFIEQENNTKAKNPIKLKPDVKNGYYNDFCFENPYTNDTACGKINTGTFKYKVLDDGSIKWGIDVGNYKNPVTIVFDKNWEEAGFIIDWSDFDEAGLNYTIEDNIITIYNPEVADGWLDPVIRVDIISDSTAYNNQRNIVTTSTGITYVVYTATDGSFYQIVTDKLNSDGTVNESFNITNITGVESERYPSSIIDSNDIIHSVFDDVKTDGWIDTSYTQFNTSDNTVLGYITIVNATSGTTESFRPDIVILDNGSIGVSYEREDGGAPRKDIRFKQCGSNCLTYGNWESEVTIADGSSLNNQNQQFSDLETNGTGYFVVWYGKDATYTTNNQIFYSVSANGSSWSVHEAVYGNDSVFHSIPSLIVKNDIPMVICEYYATGSSTVPAFNKKVGGSWINWTEIINETKINIDSPSLSTDGTNLYAVWKANNLTGINQNCIGISNSNDDGNTWSNAECVNGSLQTSGKTTNYPTLSYQNGHTDWDLNLLYTKQNNTSTYNVTFELIQSIVIVDINATTQLSSPVVGNTNTTYNLSLSWNETLSNITNVEAYTIWNGTQINATKINNSYFTAWQIVPNVNKPVSVNVSWNYTYTFGGSNTSVLTNNTTQLIVDSGFNNSRLNVYLEQPSNGYFTTIGTIIFNYSVLHNSSLAIENCSLYGNFSGVWERNQTNTTSIENNTITNFSAITLPTGQYIWNVLCYDNNSGSDWGAINRTLTVQSDAPTFSNGTTNQTSIFPEINDTIGLNITVYDNYEIDTCITQINDNGSWWNYSTKNVNTNYTYNLITNFTVRNVSVIGNENVSWRVWCNNSAGLSNTSNNDTFTVKDESNPIIILNPNNFFYNNSVISNYLYPTPTINITFIDYNLFQAEVNITCNTSGSIYNWSNLNMSGNYSYTLNDTVNLSGLPLQGCQAKISASDSHTANEIPKYKVDKESYKLEYNTENGINITIESVDVDVDGTDTDKLKDRYSFEFDYKDKKYNRTFIVSSSHKLFYVKNSDYPAHFVAWNKQKSAGNWIDFDELGIKNKEYIVRKIDDNNYLVHVIVTPPENEVLPTRKKGILAWLGIGEDMTQDELKLEKYGIDEIKFNSIGGTNVYNVTYPFYIGAAINLSGVNIYDNTSIENWSVDVTTLNSVPGWNGSANVTGSWDWLENISNGTYRLDFSHPEFFSRRYTLNVQNNSQNFSYSSMNSQLNFRVRNIATGSFLTNFTVKLNNTVTGYEQNRTASSSTLSYYLNASTYSYLIEASGYDNITGNITLTYLDNATLTLNGSFLATFFFIDERTLEPFNMSSPDSIEFLLFCENSTFTTNISNTSTNATIPINCNYTKFKFVLNYGVTSYFRTFVLTPSEALSYNIYLIDKLTTQDIYNNFVLDDLLRDYDNPRIEIQKVIGNSTVQITSDWVDVENKLGAYLIENNEYIIVIHSDNQPTRIMGTYGADLSGTKTLRLYNINLDGSTGNFNGNVTYGVSIQNISGYDFAVFTYDDIGNDTSNVTWKLYRDSWNGTLIYMASTSNNSVEFTYNLSNWSNTTIYSTAEIEYVTGNFTYNKLLYEVSTIALGILSYISQNFLNWFLVLLLGTLAIMGTIKTGNMVSMGMVGIASLFVIFGWFTLSAGILALAALVALIVILKQGDKNTI